MTELRKRVALYLGLPYRVVLRRDDESDVIARIDELRGCVAHGATEAAALTNLGSTQKLWPKGT